MSFNNNDIVEFYKQETLPELFKVDGSGSRRIITLEDGSKIRFAPAPYKLHLVENLSDGKIIPGHKKHQGEFFMENFALDNPEDGFSKEGKWLPVALLGSTRVMYFGKFEPGVKSEVVCRSTDGKVPSRSVVVPQAPACADCPNSKWTKGDDSNLPPKCGETIHVIFFDIDKKIFFQYGFSSTRISPWNKLIKKVNVVLDTAFIRGLDLSTYVILAKTVDKSSFYNFDFDYVALKDVNTEIYKPLITWYLDNVLPEIIQARTNSETSMSLTSSSSSPVIDAAVIEGFDKVGLGDKDLGDIEI